MNTEAPPLDPLMSASLKYNDTLHRLGNARFQEKLWRRKGDEAEKELEELEIILANMQKHAPKPETKKPSNSPDVASPAP